MTNKSFWVSDIKTCCEKG